MKIVAAAFLALLQLPCFSQVDFSLDVKGDAALLRSGSLTAKVSRGWPGLTIESPLGKDTVQPNCSAKPEEFGIVVDSQDRKALVWLGEPVVQGGNLVQFTCVYEIRRGIDAVFVSSRLYNREDSIKSNCYMNWGFRAKYKEFESSSGTVQLAGTSQKLKGAMDWALFHKIGESQGLCIVTDGLDKLPRKFSANASISDWRDGVDIPKVWMALASNHGDDGLHGTTGIAKELWHFSPGYYNEIKLVVFHAKDADDAKSMFKRLSSDPELMSIWKY